MTSSAGLGKSIEASKRCHWTSRRETRFSSAALAPVGFASDIGIRPCRSSAPLFALEARLVE